MKIGLYGINAGLNSDRESVLRYARTAEAANFESLWTGEHVVAIDPQVPPSPLVPDTPIVDTVATLAFVAAPPSASASPAASSSSPSATPSSSPRSSPASTCSRVGGSSWAWASAT